MRRVASCVALGLAAAVLPAAVTAHAAVLHDQFAAHPSANVSSQDFEPALNAFDSLGADDFVVPKGRVWQLRRVQVAAHRQGTGEAESANLFLLSDTAGLPGATLLERLEVAPSTALEYPDLDLSVSDPPLLPAGRYWVAVQANLVFNPGANNWWWADHAPQAGRPAVWRQPGDGFGDGCTSFIVRHTCPSYSGSQSTPDQAFRLLGNAAGARLKLVKAKRRRGGNLVLRVNAPAPGRLVAAGKRFKRAQRTLGTIGRFKLRLRAKPSTRKLLRAGRRVRARINLRLRTSSGQVLRARAVVRLRR